MHLLGTVLTEPASPVFEDLFAKCLLCGACEQVCPRNLPITTLIAQARGTFSTFYGKGGLTKVVARTVLARPQLLEGLVRAGISLKRIHALPKHSGLRLRLGLLEPRASQRRYPAKPAAREESGVDISYFTGCLARHLQPSVASSTQALLHRAGQRAFVPDEQCCCGLASWSAGQLEQARNLAQQNIQAFSSSSGPIITSCASCSSQLYSYPDLFDKDDPWHQKAIVFAERVEEFTSYFSSLLSLTGSRANLAVFYHDPCHLRFREKGMSAPRNLLRSAGLHVVESDNGPFCCGQGGLFHLGYPETSEKIFTRSTESVFTREPDYITTTCSGCLMQYQQATGKRKEFPPVIHLANLLLKLCTDTPD